MKLQLVLKGKLFVFNDFSGASCTKPVQENVGNVYVPEGDAKLILIN